MRNLEIKIAISNIEKIKNNATKIGAENMGFLYQTDTYFIIGKKRLKLREEKGGCYLVFYARPNILGSKFSKYFIMNVSLLFSKVVKEIFSFIFGIKIIVNKKRNLFIYKNTRIHLDEVKGLGSYVELETIFEDGNEKMSKKEHFYVLESLGLSALASIKESYSDLISLK